MCELRDKLMFMGDASTFFKEKGGAKNLPIGKIKLPHFIIVNGFDFSISGSGYRVARTLKNIEPKQYCTYKLSRLSIR